MTWQKKDLAKIYYAQTLPFTCGAAAMVMALVALEKIKRPQTPATELDFWRRAHSIYMGAGHAGCGPYALARLGLEMGCNATVAQTQEGKFFAQWHTCENEAKAEQLMECFDKEQALQKGAHITDFPPNPEAFMQTLQGRKAALLLVGQNVVEDGHWLCVFAAEQQIFILDPYQAEKDHSTPKIDTFSPEKCFEQSHYLGAKVAIVLS